MVFVLGYGQVVCGQIWVGLQCYVYVFVYVFIQVGDEIGGGVVDCIVCFL